MAGSAPHPAFCACCTSSVPPAPAIVWNRPGLSRIMFRIGTFATFREALLEGIAAEASLAALTTRESDDYAITLLELSAALGDVLTFYNERIANELFIRTARERDSVLRLVRLIGYRLRPGLAATAMLAFGLDASAETRIRRGLKVMSVPGQDERPQTFETLEQIVAHGDLNAVQALAPPMPFNAFQKGQTRAPLVDYPKPLMQGDAIVIFGFGAIEEKTIDARDGAAGDEHLSFSPPVQSRDWWPGVVRAEKIQRRLRFFGYNAPIRFPSYDPSKLTWSTPAIDGSYTSPDGNYPLDTRYDDLKIGTRLLIDVGPVPDTTPRLLTAVVLASSEQNASINNIGNTATYAQDTVTCAQLGQTIRGQPIAAPLNGGHRVLARTGAGTLIDFDPLGGATSWESITNVASDVSALSTGANRIDAFARNGFGVLSAATWVSGAWNWTNLDGVITSTPKALALTGGEIIVFARGFDFALWYRNITLGANDVSGGPWTSLSGIVASDPAVISAGSNIDVFVRGIDRGLWLIARNGGVWSDWQPLHGKLASAPAAASTGSNHVDVVALDDDGSVAHRRRASSGWSHWRNLGGQVKGTPAIVATGPDSVGIFALGADGQLWQIARVGNTWSPWIPLGGKLAGAPSAIVHNGDVLIYAQDSDGLIAGLTWSGGWQPWNRIAADLGMIDDRRQTRIYQLADREISFREFEYPPMLFGGKAAIRLKPGQHALGGLAKLDKGRRILVESGATKHFATVNAAVPFASAPGEPEDHLLVDFSPSLPRPLAKATLKGNIAEASHGETQPDETLGNGDASKNFLKYRLARSPLTYLPSETSLQGDPALEIRVSGERWQNVASLYGHGATKRVFTARTTDAGDTIVTFGDGRTGARVPSGAMNVVARYRRGLGLEGLVRADQLSIAMERPVGLRTVTNPLPAEGGADPEKRDDARNTAPTAIRTFGRAVSLQDFEWIVTSSGLISRAFVTWVWYELQRAVHLTVAAAAGAKLSEDALGKLYVALNAVRDPNRRLFLANLVRVPIVVKVRIIADPALEQEKVLQAARAGIAQLFSFEAMPLGAAVHASHVYSALQVKGVLAVGIDLFHLKGFQSLSAKERAVRAVTADPVQQHIRIFEARPTPSDPSLIDRYAHAGFVGSPPPVLPAEQAFIQNPATDLALSLVEAL